MPTHDTYPPERDSFRHQELIQWADGRKGLGFRTPGDRIIWDKHKYTRNLHWPSLPGVAIVSMESGRHFAIGSGVAVMLPGTLTKEGKFVDDSKGLYARSIVEKENLPDLTIGEPWELTGGDDRVVDVLIDYNKVGKPEEGAIKSGAVNPFDHAGRIVRAVAQRLDETGRLEVY